VQMLSMQMPISFDKAHGLPPSDPSMVIELPAGAGRLNERIRYLLNIEVNRCRSNAASSAVCK